MIINNLFELFTEKIFSLVGYKNVSNFTIIQF